MKFLRFLEKQLVEFSWYLPWNHSSIKVWNWLQSFFRASCNGNDNNDFPSGKSGEPLERPITKTIENHSILQQKTQAKFSRCLSNLIVVDKTTSYKPYDAMVSLVGKVGKEIKYSLRG